jgi:2-polyprenyl-3-methyl-5-hydroxy-6-metoxy-1,4-benzoquinol methylase
MDLQNKTAYNPAYAPMAVINAIPESAKSVLDVGAGPGGVGRVLREKGFSGRIVAIEPVAERIASNLTYYNESHNCYIEDFKNTEAFDAILLADVLEHMQDPWAALIQLKKLLSESGSLIVQVPNVMHPDFIVNFMCGAAQYQPAGICDITHIRWFNRLSILKAVKDAGYEVNSISRVFKTNQEQDIATKPFSAQHLRLKNGQTNREILVPAEDRADYLTFQYVVQASLMN